MKQMKQRIVAGLIVAVFSAANLEAKTFNVIDYGAKGDGKTDNTAAFSACLKDVVDAGGGKMLVPDGVYHGRIVIPPVIRPTPSWITVEIVGESVPTPVWGTIGNFPLQDNGTILTCLEKSGAGAIAAMPATKGQALYGDFSAVNVVIRNLEVRTYDNPGIDGIDLRWAMQGVVENVVVNTGVYNVRSSEPTHKTTGLVTPANGNAALTVLRNVLVTGYHTGILVHEHTDADSINLGSNVNGLEFAFAHHASRFGRVCAQRCTHAVTVSGEHAFSIQQLDLEVVGPRQSDAHNEWQKSRSDLNDPKNLGTGDIRYWVVRGNAGVVDDFSIQGGKRIRACQIGAKQPEKP